MYKNPFGKDSSHWQGGKIKRGCIICGKIFYVDKNIVLKGNGRFCSLSCAGKRDYGHHPFAPQKELYCVVCGKTFYDYVSRLTKDKTRGKCCSIKCRVKYTQKRISGKLCYRWKGGITSKNKLIRSQMKTRNWSRKVKERDNYTCQKCGIRSSKGVKVYLHSHHVKPFALYPKLRFTISNGQTLCNNCHLRPKADLSNEILHFLKEG